MSDAPAVDARLAALGLVLPQPATPLANYLPVVISGSLAVLSGQLPLRDGVLTAAGRLGEAVSVEQGTEAAALCFLNLLAQLRVALGGDLGRLRRVLRLGGFVACTPAFTQHAAVMNGASDLAVAALGEAGRHARSTVGVPSLPLGAAVEIEGLFELG